MPADLDQTGRVEFANKLRLIYLILVDAHITEEETEALIANNSKSIFVGNVSDSRCSVCGAFVPWKIRVLILFICQISLSTNEITIKYIHLLQLCK